MSYDITGTFYVPDGEARTVTFAVLREGNEESRVMLTDDRGTLLAYCRVDEAETDGLLLLKQYDAGHLIDVIQMSVDEMGRDPAGPWLIDRTGARLSIEYVPVETAAEAMGDE